MFQRERESCNQNSVETSNFVGAIARHTTPVIQCSEFHKKGLNSLSWDSYLIYLIDIPTDDVIKS